MARRRGKKIATTAVARKLLTRAFHLLRDADADAVPTRRGRGSTKMPASTTPSKATASKNTSITSPSGNNRTGSQTGRSPAPG